MGVQLANSEHVIHGKPYFFERHLVRGKYARLTPEQLKAMTINNEEAEGFFREAFPEIFEKREKSRENQLPRSIQDIVNDYKAAATHKSGPIGKKELVSGLPNL
jgi:polyhydroxyalkanoate synthesis regulator phasin